MRLRAFGMWLNLLVAGVLMLAIWVLLVWVGSRPAIKTLIDLSPQQRSTIDPVTVDMLHDLAAQQVKVEFHTFFGQSGLQPQDAFQLQRQRILERLRELTAMLLRQYEFHGGDQVKVRLHDQYGDIAGTREATQRFGVTDNDVVVVSVQQPGRPPRHRTLSLEGDLGVVDLPQLRQSPVPGAMLPVLKDYKGEEALSSAIKSLLLQGTPVVYLLWGTARDRSPDGTGAGYGLLQDMLRSFGFDVRELDLLRAGTVPKDAAVVAALEPRGEFADTEVRILSEYLHRGGRLFLNYSFAMTPDYNTDGGELGRILGFELGLQQVHHLILDPRAGPQVRGLDGDPRVSKIDLYMNGNHPITLRLARGNQLLQVDNARSLTLTDKAPEGVRREGLLFTGPQAWIARRDREGMPDTHAPKLDSMLSSYSVGAAFEIDSAPDADGKRSKGEAVVVSGLFCNNLGIRLNNQLVANIFNWLAERRVLLDIRGSSYVSRNLVVQPQQLARIWWLLVAFVPGVLLAAGLVVHRRRRTA